MARGLEARLMRLEAKSDQRVGKPWLLGTKQPPSILTTGNYNH